ncbi:Signal peptidase IB [Seminavis robusta]|uniref:Mitochondrial inner membrane protease subunit n=1 Tax=Seminavis robusta TaxID=568900 RepID=A0A9N8DMP6_9STRA|nr:Signal peptidase IB [Seminavis robusta]|eukprot:Sro168_g074800.1 Signal peptidase IB (577) ;mRNA; r:40903-42633
MKHTPARLIISILLLLLQQFRECSCLSLPISASISKTGRQVESFSVPLLKERPKPETLLGNLRQLWNDPRPVSSLIDTSNNKENSSNEDVPYCILSDEFQLQQMHKFRILLYPKGRYYGGSSSNALAGPAAAYLRYIPDNYGDEVDISWKLRLVDSRTGHALPVMTSGGLPRSNTTWSSGMTFCSELEDIESVGRAADWGSSTWYAQSVCDALGHIEANVEITLYNFRTDESSFAIPPRGAVKAVLDAATGASAAVNGEQERLFRVGEVIVPMASSNSNKQTEAELKSYFVLPGTDYRIMTMTDKDGNSIFASDSVPKEERKYCRLALRPCGWKTQQQLWKQRGMKTEWPVEVPARLLSSTALTRFNLATAFPRVSATFQRDKTAVLLGILLALAPLPGALIARNFVSFYAIPSASMDPTLMKGDLLLVEKFPGVSERTQKGDVLLFRPPAALREIVGNNAISSNSLFVKRVVGLPGDRDFLVDSETGDVYVEGKRAIGPDRNLCDDEPLRLIDRLLENGKGKKVDQLGDDEVYVLGDCKAVSVDSRVFGVLPKTDIAGKPVGRVWPLSRVTFGPL